MLPARWPDYTLKTYVYRAALWCERCADVVRPVAPDTGDSDDYPQGPFRPDESDCPQHCDRCGLFLENPLTPDGRAYVESAIADSDGDKATLATWADFYGINLKGLPQ